MSSLFFSDRYVAVDAISGCPLFSVRGQLDKVKVDGTEVADVNYDSVGERASITETNSGTTDFDYYSTGWLKQVEDAKSDKTQFEYDALGRVKERIDGLNNTNEVTNTWTWDAAGAVGYLASRSSGPTSSSAELTESYAYTDGRLDSITTSVNVSGFSDNSSYVIDYDYDTYGRLETITYPNSIAFDNVYLSTGYLSQVKKGFTVLHEYTDVDAFGNIVGEDYGNGLETARDHDPETGLLTSIETGTTGMPNSVQDLLYAWRTNGTLLSRTNEKGTATTSDDLIETFDYDALNRLEEAETGASVRTLTNTYDDHGNLLSKLSDVTGDLDVTSYSYGTSTKPHRLDSATIAGISNTFSYDAAGNVTQYNAASGDDTFINYDEASRVTEILVGDVAGDTTPTARDRFWYGPDGQRFLREATWDDGGTLKTSWTLYLLGGTFEEVHPDHDSSVNYRQRVLVTSNVQHQYTKYPSSSTASIDYLHRDHLGNVVGRSNESGTVVSSVDFDPFGLQRGTQWDRDATSGEMDGFADDDDTFTGRGFTDHEMLNRTGFVHMNGRVFDARIGRFIQPDPIVGNPINSQNHNRYSYVLNTPLSATDPSGLDIEFFFRIRPRSWRWYTPGRRNFRAVNRNSQGPGRAPTFETVSGILDRLFNIYSCVQLAKVGASCIGGLGGAAGIPGVGSSGSGVTGLPEEGWEGIILNIDEEDDQENGPITSVIIVGQGDEVDDQIWTMLSTILQAGGSISEDAGDIVLVETSSQAGPLPTHAWQFEVLAWPLDSDGELAAVVAGPMWFERIRYTTFTGGNTRPNFVLQATGGPSEYGYRWFIKIPLTSAGHDNNTGQTLSIYRRN
ncbi:MAG: hypothetical protein DRR42_23115 [Gammaproteobacteria bacterium]|nr:MAG: hypothetical protein DRR42_23115 [Gammaproteobacteria bacterium]